MQRWHIIARKNFEDFKKERQIQFLLVFLIYEGYKTLYRYGCMVFNWDNISVKERKTKRKKIL